jgi:hypothetical protein
VSGRAASAPSLLARQRLGVAEHDDREGRKDAVVDVPQELIEDLDVDGIRQVPRALRGETHSIAAISLFGTNADARMALSVASAAQ